MARIAVFQHVAAEPLGTLDRLIRARGHRIRFINFDRHPDAQPRMDQYDGLILLGGPMNMEESDRYPHLNAEARAVEQALAQDKPVLGICLGAQIVAHTLGARVFRSEQSEIGWYPVLPTAAAASDEVLNALSAPQPIFQWHGCTFDLPADGQLLASSAICQNQAFRYGSNTYGFQFHLEMDQPLIQRWLSIPHYLDDLQSNGLQSVEQIETQTRTNIQPLMQLADQVFNRFLNLIGAPSERIALPSR